MPSKTALSSACVPKYSATATITSIVGTSQRLVRSASRRHSERNATREITGAEGWSATRGHGLSLRRPDFPAHPAQIVTPVGCGPRTDRDRRVRLQGRDRFGHRFLHACALDARAAADCCRPRSAAGERDAASGDHLIAPQGCDQRDDLVPRWPAPRRDSTSTAMPDPRGARRPPRGCSSRHRRHAASFSPLSSCSRSQSLEPGSPSGSDPRGDLPVQDVSSETHAELQATIARR